jgi:hypothetical protein
MFLIAGLLLPACATQSSKPSQPLPPTGIPTGPRSAVAVPNEVALLGAIHSQCGSPLRGLSGVTMCKLFPVGPILKKRLLWEVASVSSTVRDAASPRMGCENDLEFAIPKLKVLDVSTEGRLNVRDVYIYDFEVTLEARAGRRMVKQSNLRERVRVDLSSKSLWSDRELEELFEREGAYTWGLPVQEFVSEVVADFEEHRAPRPADEPLNEANARCGIRETRDLALAGQAREAAAAARRTHGLCKVGCSPESSAAALMLLGTLCAREDRGAASKLFGHALRIDRKATIDPALATPEAGMALAQARAALPAAVPPLSEPERSAPAPADTDSAASTSPSQDAAPPTVVPPDAGHPTAADTKPSTEPSNGTSSNPTNRVERFIGSWTWNGDTMVFSHGGTGSYSRDGVLCYRFRYLVDRKPGQWDDESTVTIQADRENSCGGSVAGNIQWTLRFRETVAFRLTATKSSTGRRDKLSQQWVRVPPP